MVTADPTAYIPLNGGKQEQESWVTSSWRKWTSVAVKPGDINGGLIIGIIMLCQTMAHASLANLLVVQGPYCAVVPPLAYTLVGQSPHASISSGAIVAILIDDVIPGDDQYERSRLASALATLVGAVLVVGGLCNGSFFVRFLSRPTLTGFITGGSFIITASQLPKFLGIPTDKLGHGSNFFAMVCNLVKALRFVNKYAVSIGSCVLVVLQLGKRAKKSNSKWKPERDVLRRLQKIFAVLLEFKEFICVLASMAVVWLLTPMFFSNF